MKISLACAQSGKSIWIQLELEEGATVADAIARANLPRAFLGFQLEERCIGVFGKPAKPDAPLHAGDRVEIYPGMAM